MGICLAIFVLFVIFCCGVATTCLMATDKVEAKYTDVKFGVLDPSYHVLATALLNDLTIDEAHAERREGSDKYNEGKKAVYSLLYGGK
jgi:hypothetical protein